MKPFRTLYIFPHPDDESFGPAPVIYRQTKKNEEVFLLTLTRGGATKVRFKYNYSIKEMGEVRVKEMEKVKQVLNLSGMEIWDMEDGSLAYMNPIDLENMVSEHIEKINPDVVVTYAVHGISGHHDHLAIHAAVKRIFSESFRNKKFPNWKRLALFTFPKPENSDQDGAMAHVRTSPLDKIDCVIELNQEEKQKLRESLYCYETFVDVIESTQVIERIGDKVYFEFFDEDFKPVLNELTDQL